MAVENNNHQNSSHIIIEEQPQTRYGENQKGWKYNGK